MTAPTQLQQDPNTEVNTGGMVALIPADPYPDVLAVPGGLPKDQLHLTLCYLGDDVTTWPPELGTAVREVIREMTGSVPADDGDGPVAEQGPGMRGPLTLTVFAHSNFNPTGADGREPCMVYQFSGDGDLPMVEALASEVQYRVKDEIGEVNFPDQHARFAPHVTAGYGLPPDALSYIGPVVFDRIRVELADDYTDIPLGGDSSMTAAAPTAPIEVVEDQGDEIRVRFPVLALEGVDTGDGRFIEHGGLTHRALPLSLLAQPYTSHGGQEPPPAEVFGNISVLTPLPGPQVVSPRTGEPYGDDVRVWTGEGTIDGTHRYANLVRKQYLRGISVDLADLNAEFVDEETAALSEHPRRQIIVSTAEIGGATMVPVPAFADAYVEIIGEETAAPLAASALPAGMLTTPQPMWRSPEVGDEVVMLQRTPSGAVTQKARDEAKKEGHTVPGTDSFPIKTRQDVINAVKRAGSAKDPVKARKHIMKEARRLKATDEIPDNWNSDGTVKDDKAVTAAAVASTRPPLSMFSNPELVEETPITVETEEGSSWRCVFGHIASWRRPHIGFGGQKVYPPKSRCDYAEFMRGGYRVDDRGTPRIVAVGHLTMDTGHADLSLAAASTAHHYDHTGFAWADVAAGEDDHGIWVSGVVKPWVTEEQLDVALAHPPSGDWRPIGNGLELVAVLCVNTPGFGIYRARVASGQVQAMVASSGIPTKDPDTLGALDYDRLAEALAWRLETRQQQRAALVAQQSALLTELDDAPQRMAEILADFPDDEENDFTLSSEEIASFDVGRMPPQLRESYLHGKAAAKILWGTPGDFARCEAEATHHGIPKRMRAGMCATLHKEALGVAPGKEHGK